MSKSKKADTTPKENAAPVYQTERLLKSKALAMYQPDFAAVILKKDFYTLEEAKAALDAALKKGAN